MVNFTVLASQDQTTPMAPPVSGTWRDPRGTTSLSALGTLLCNPRQVVLQTMWKFGNMMLQVQIFLITRNICRNRRTHLDIPHIPYAAFALGHVLGKHCGSALPASVDTSDSFAFVKFVSDSSGNAAGFSLAFEASVEGTVEVFRVLLSWLTAQN